MSLDLFLSTLLATSNYVCEQGNEMLTGHRVITRVVCVNTVNVSVICDISIVIVTASVPYVQD